MINLEKLKIDFDSPEVQESLKKFAEELKRRRQEDLIYFETENCQRSFHIIKNNLTEQEKGTFFCDRCEDQAYNPSDPCEVVFEVSNDDYCRMFHAVGERFRDISYECVNTGIPLLDNYPNESFDYDGVRFSIVQGQGAVLVTSLI